MSRYVKSRRWTRQDAACHRPFPTRDVTRDESETFGGGGTSQSVTFIMPSQCWSSTLQRLLKPYRDPERLFYDSCNPRSSRHPSGIIWKKALIECIVADLYLLESSSNSDEEDECQDLLLDSPCSVNRQDRLPQREKRFVRMEELGLGAIITFEIPHPAGRSQAQFRDSESQEALFTMDTTEVNDVETDKWTLRKVFGDPDDPEVQGMEIDDLLDNISAKVSYVPLYACTSFAVSVFPRSQTAVSYLWT